MSSTKPVRKVLLIVVVLLVVLAGAGYWWAQRPLPVSHTIDLPVKRGDGPAEISKQAVQGGARTPQWLLEAWLRAGSLAGPFKAGAYELQRGDSPLELLRKLLRGEFATRKVRLGEGWTFRQVRDALAKADGIRHDTASMSDAAVLQALGRKEAKPEGLFFPDTYKVVKQSSDLDVLRLALRTMDRKLDAAWQSRASDLPLTSPYELLKLASLIEKETGAPGDRAMVSAVFANRLRAGMRLQTDPTVIYGMGDDYAGTLRRADLQRDTPYNTYTRGGLPPTPIALPSEAALAAAANPADTKALYFVSRGDGTSEFSETLDAHNRAVDRYIHGKQ